MAELTSRPAEGGVVPLGLAELEEVYVLDAACFPPGIAFPREVFEYCLEADDSLCLGVQDTERRLAGFIVVQAKSFRTAQIVTVDVRADYRRRGVADLLMRAVLERLAERGMRRVDLQVAVDNAAGQALYRKWGFVEGRRLKDYYRRGLDAFQMAKTIGNAGAD